MTTLLLWIFTVVFAIINAIAPGPSYTFDDLSTPASSAATEVSQIIRHTDTPEPVLSPTTRPTAEIVPTEADPTMSPAEMVQLSPKVIFGGPQIIENFERGSSGFGINAGLNDEEGIRIIALNNRISLEPKKNGGWLSWRLRPPSIKDGAAEMEFSIITCARGDRTGLVMHAPDYKSGKGYYFSIACEGTVSILRDTTVLGTADAGSLFKNSSGDINILTAVIRGDTLTAVLNGQSALTVKDDTYAEGFSGFFTAPQNQDTLTLDIMTFNGFYPQQ